MPKDRKIEGLTNVSNSLTEFLSPPILNEVLPAKLTIDLDYFSKQTLVSDLLLIVRTILSVSFQGKTGPEEPNRP